MKKHSIRQTFSVMFGLNFFLLTLFAFIIIIQLNSCSRTRNNITKKIHVGALQTLQNQAVFPILEKGNVILGPKNKNASEKELENQDKINDTTLSLTERLASNDKKEMAFEVYKKANPLFAVLNPNVFQNENGDFVLSTSSFIGFSIINDTANVMKYLTSKEIINLFPVSTRFVWSKSIFQENVYGLSAITDSCKTINFTPSDIEYFIIKEKDEPFRILKSLHGSNKYSFYIKFNTAAANEFNKFSENKIPFLLSVQVNSNLYRTSITFDDFLNDIALAENLSSSEIELIRENCSDLLKEN